MVEGRGMSQSFNTAIKSKHGATLQTKGAAFNAGEYGTLHARAASPARAFQIDIEKFRPSYRPVSLYYLKYTRQRQQAVLMLQHCAILSQLNRHQDALDISKTTALLIKEITQMAAQIIRSKRENQEERERWTHEHEQIIEMDRIIREAQDEYARAEAQGDSYRAGGSVQAGLQQERRGRNGRKPSAASTSGRPMSRAEYLKNRSISQLSKQGSKLSVRSVGGRGPGAADVRSRLSRGSRNASSRSLSQMSKASQKSVKSINASLERTHTFGMANTHKSLYDIEKIDNQYDMDLSSAKKRQEESGGSEKKIKKSTSSTSLAKLKSVINQNLNGEQEEGGNGAAEKQPAVRSGGPPMAQLKSQDPKETSNSDLLGHKSAQGEASDDQGVKNPKVSNKKSQKAVLSTTTPIHPNDNQQLLGDAQIEGPSNVRKSEKISLCQSAALISGPDALNQPQDDEIDATNDDDLKLPLDNMSSINSISGGDNPHSVNQADPTANQTKTSYYVRDQFQPIRSHQTNIEKLLIQFKEQQQQFVEVIFQNRIIQHVSQNQKSTKSTQEALAERGSELDGGRGSLPAYIAPETLKQLKLSFSSIDEIERMKRDANMYKQTQRNALGVAKTTKGEMAGSRRTAKMNWIDLFNIGNVMLMRGQDIQMSHQGWSELGEFDTLSDIIALESNAESTMARTGSARGSNDLQGGAAGSARLEAQWPELSLQRCRKYAIAKDSFTEIVLLTIIAYFCVSTEQRFININQEKQENNKDTAGTGRGSIAEKTNRSELLNNSDQSLPHSIKSAGTQSVGGGLNSTLQRSTKAQTQTSSTQRQLAGGPSGGSNQQVKNNNTTETRQIESSKASQNSKFSLGSSGGVSPGHPQAKPQSKHGSRANGLGSEPTSPGRPAHTESDSAIEAAAKDQHHHFKSQQSAHLQGPQHETPPHDKSDHQEYFLAKALHFGIQYLPPESPLVQHLTQNYIKNFLQQKIEQREQLISRFTQ